MKLHLKRSESKSLVGSPRYDLFAQLEASPEEQALIRKSNPQKQLLWEGDPAVMTGQWRWSLVKAAPLAFLAAVIVSLLISPFLFIFVAVGGWFFFAKLIMNRNQDGISLADLLTGRTVHCKDMTELIVKENALQENAAKYSNFLRQGLGGSERQTIDL